MTEDVGFNTEEALNHTLISHGVDTSAWGENGAKTVADLLTELSERELLGRG